MIWECEMGAECLMRGKLIRPSEFQWSCGLWGKNQNKGFYCMECIRESELFIGWDAPFLSDILNAAKDDSA